MPEKTLSKLTKLLPLVVILAGIIVSTGIWVLLENGNRKNISRIVEENASNLKNNIEIQLGSHVRALERMAARWAERGATPKAEWDSDAGNYVKDFSGYQAIEWVDAAGKIRWVIPEMGNEAAINFDLMSEPTRRTALEKARDSRVTVISHNVDLVQGGKGFLVFVPVYHKDEFGGFIVGIFRTENFFALGLSPDVARNYSVRLYDNETPVYDSESAGAVASEYTTERLIEVSGIRWKLQVAPTERTAYLLNSTSGTWALVIGAFLSFLLGWVVRLGQVAKSQTVRTQIFNKKLDELTTLQKAVLDGANYMIIATDPVGKILSFNKAAERNLGYSAKELIGKVTPAVFHDPAEVEKRAGEMSEELGCEIESGFEVFVHNSRNRQVEEREWTYIRKDGSKFPVLLSITALRDETGEITGFLGVGDDITEKKRAVAELRAAEERFRKFMNNSPVVACQKDTGGRYVFINDTMKRYFHLDVEKMIGKTDYDWLSEEIAASARKNDLTVLTTGQTLEYEQTVTAPDGIARIWQTYKFPIYDIDGLPYVGIVAFDITTQKEAETALRESENRFRRQLQSSPVGIVLTAAEGGVEFVNEHWSKITGLTLEESVGTGWVQAVHPDDRERIVREWSEQSQAAEETSYEFRFVNKTGQTFEVFARALKRYDEDGAFEGHFATVADVTEIRRLQSDLKDARDAAIESARLKAEFLANMSHEIRTPMNGVIGMTDILLAGELSEEQRDYAQTIKTSADGLLTIINDILDFSKIEAGKLNFEAIDFNLLHTVESTVQLFAEQSRRKKIELVSFVESNVNPNLIGDPGRLRQVLTNLIGNAVKFTENGEVIVRVVKESETNDTYRLRFSISDTGIGISPPAQKYLFQAFTQADGSMTRKYGGTGLGLTISKKLVELMNGEIQVESAPGKGSVFSFTADFEKQLNPARRNLVPRADISNLRILIVDDNATNRKILVEQVTAWGMVADEANDGMTALIKLREAAEKNEKFDIALLDLMMPSMSGFELAYFIKSDLSINGVKLILMPSFGEPGHAKAAKENGIDGYLIKPIRQSDLYHAIASLTADEPTEAAPIDQEPIQFVTKHVLDEQKQRRNGTILLAEDNEVNQKVARIQIEKLGYQIDVVSNGIEAVQASRKHPYSLILMDCQMPEMDGYQATTEIRKRDAGDRYIPIIAMTANAMQGEREKCFAAGMDDYISKPVRIEILDKTLTQWLNGNRVRQTDQASLISKISVQDELADLSGTPTLDESVLEGYRELQIPGETDFVADLIDLFIKDATERMKILESAVVEGNRGEIKKQAHTFKGSAGNVGAFRLAKLGKIAEESLEQSDKVRRLVEQMADELEQVVGKLESIHNRGTEKGQR